MHDVGWADVDAVAASVAARHVDKCRHVLRVILVSSFLDRSVVSRLLSGAAKNLWLCSRMRKVAPRTIRFGNALLKRGRGLEEHVREFRPWHGSEQHGRCEKVEPERDGRP